VYLKSTDELITGGHDGCIRLWDLTGGMGANQQGTKKPARIIDTIFMETVTEPPYTKIEKGGV
jgi:hypothetical protein